MGNALVAQRAAAIRFIGPLQGALEHLPPGHYVVLAHNQRRGFGPKQSDQGHTEGSQALLWAHSVDDGLQRCKLGQGVLEQ